MKKRVLVVDDDSAIRHSLKKILENTGYQVALAEDGQVAVDRFTPGEIDLIVLDLNLPFKDGWETFENITRCDPSVPVIIITGQINQYPFSRCAGAGALFEKPVEVPVLLDTIKSLLTQPREQPLRRMCGEVDDTRFVRSSPELFQEELRERAETPLQLPELQYR